MKLELAIAIRTAGWHAELEVRANDGSWRADVMATRHDGTGQMAWEAQLSPLTDDEIIDRTLRYEADGIRVCWVSPAEDPPPWMGVVPSLRVMPHDDQPWNVTDGIAEFDLRKGRWNTLANVDLGTVVGWALRGQTMTQAVVPRYRRVWNRHDQRYRRRHSVWTTSPHAQAQLRHNAMRERQEQQKRRREEQEAQAAEQRRQQKQAEAAELARQREMEAEAARKKREEQQRVRAAEQQRRLAEWQEQQRAAEQKRLRLEQEAEQQRQRREQELEQRRLEQQQAEQRAAHSWWEPVSAAQLRQLQDLVDQWTWAKFRAHAEFDKAPLTAESGYGITVRLASRHYGSVRPSPRSLHHLPQDATIFVRNAREADLIREAEPETTHTILHFDLPDHEQLSLL